MLYKLYCSEFREKEITFHEGLNVVTGDEVASNSIGKSTILMIIDFIFGGEKYITTNSGAIDAVGHHTFKYALKFDEELFYFIRSTDNYKYISICNENYVVKKEIETQKYTEWLQQKYDCKLLDMSFRDIIGRYSRVYGKENLNEKKPIQYFEKETSKHSIESLLKLFDKYSVLKAYDKQLEKLNNDKKTLEKAAVLEFVPSITTKTSYNNNAKKITELSNEMDELKKNIINSSTDIEALVSKDILAMRSEKSKLITEKNRLNNKLNRVQNNLNYKNSNIQPELNKFVKYFPDFNVELVKEVDQFHKTISKNLKAELKNSAKELQSQIKELDNDISSIDKEIVNKLNIKNAPRMEVEKIVELVAHINRLRDENEYYEKKTNYTANIKSTKQDYNKLKESALDDICNQMNSLMEKINTKIYVDGKRSPNLNIHGSKYSFKTYGDTGTGTAYANLITFDLALLELTCLPSCTHDLPLLKNIENAALSNIINLYSELEKQIFISLDKVKSYGDETYNIIEQKKVLELSKNKLLFNKNWKSE